MKKRTNWKVLISCIVLVYASALLGSFFSSSNTNTDWYQAIKPAITPPNYIFPIVWNILFLLIAFSLYLAWTSAKKNQKTPLASIFAINLIFNSLWSILFFGIKNPFLAFFDLLAIWVTIIGMIYVTYQIKKKSSYLLWPYLIWVSFAGILNYLIAFS